MQQPNGRPAESNESPPATELEANAIEHLCERLHVDFPEVPDESIDETVATRYHQLDGRPIRDFVPVLVEHAAKSDLIEERTR